MSAQSIMIVNRPTFVIPIADCRRIRKYYRNILATYVNLFVNTWKEHIHQLTLGGPGAQLLNFTELCLEAVIDPGQDVVSGMKFKFILNSFISFLKFILLVLQERDRS